MRRLTWGAGAVLVGLPLVQIALAGWVFWQLLK